MRRQYFDFSELITDFENPFTVIYSAGEGYDAKGDWSKGAEVRKELKGAIIGFRESKVYRSGGASTAKDKRLFMHSPLPKALIGAKVRYRGQEYMIESELENAEFTGVYSYFLRWCSAFDRL